MINILKSVFDQKQRDSQLKFQPLTDQKIDPKIVQIKNTQTTTIVNGLPQYHDKVRLRQDCALIFEKYQDLFPTRIDYQNGPLLEIHGSFSVLYGGTVYKIIVVISFLYTYPAQPPVLRIKNFDPNQFYPNSFYSSSLEYGGVFINMTKHLILINHWSTSTKILEVIAEAQQVLTSNFPFFKYTNKQQRQIQSPHQTSLQPPVGAWGSQTQIQQRQQQVPVSPSQNQNQPINQATQENQGDITSGLTSILSSFMIYIPFTSYSKAAESQKNLEALGERTKQNSEAIVNDLKVNIIQGREFLDELVVQHQKQDKQMQQMVSMQDEMLNKLNEAGNCGTGYDEFIQKNYDSSLNLEGVNQLIEVDQFSEQLIGLMGDIQAYQETINFVNINCRQGKIDLDQALKITRKLSEQMFDATVLMKKCLKKQ